MIWVVVGIAAMACGSQEDARTPILDAGADAACVPVCADGQRCVGGACVPECGSGLLACGTECVDASSNSQHCGGCGAACPAGKSCVAGQCTLPCGPGLELCDGLCTNTAIDPAHCGACGQGCALDETCKSGVCWKECGAGIANCAGKCTDTAFDPKNCGGCGAQCPNGLVCSQGACTLTCGGGTKKCDDACVDTSVDPAHCGGCGQACSPSEFCSGGKCTTCPQGKVVCKGQCVYVDMDNANCGACGNYCGYVTGGTSVCNGGKCVVTCNAGYGKCVPGSSGCETNLQTSPGHCGTCGNACAAGESCIGGSCTVCPSGTVACGGSCVDVDTDKFNCGACGKACSTPPNTVATCSGGKCGWVCATSHLDCDLAPTNGCEVYSYDDQSHCGACSNACKQGEKCTAGVCTPCSSGLTLCGAFCVDLNTSTIHCGACGANCGSVPKASMTCQGGACKAICQPGYHDCDGNPFNGCEATLGNTQHCSACGDTCGTQQFCAAAGQCVTCAPIDLGSAVPQSVLGSTVGSLNHAQPTCWSPGAAPDVLFAFKAPTTGTYTFDTLGSAFDTVLVVRDGGCTGTPLGCNDNYNFLLTSVVPVGLTQGQTVVVIVDGKGTSQGAFQLNVSVEP